MRRILAATLILLSWCGLARAKDLAVISNKSNSVQVSDVGGTDKNLQRTSGALAGWEGREFHHPRSRVA